MWAERGSEIMIREIKFENENPDVEMLKVVVNRLNSDVDVLHRLLHKDYPCNVHCKIMINQLIIPTIPQEVADWIENYNSDGGEILDTAIQYVLKDFVNTDAYWVVRNNTLKYGAYDTLLHNAIRYGYIIEGE